LCAALDGSKKLLATLRLVAVASNGILIAMPKSESKSRDVKRVAHSLLKGVTGDKAAKKAAISREPLPRPTAMRKLAKEKSAKGDT
jgi:hypothetical protein